MTLSWLVVLATWFIKKKKKQENSWPISPSTSISIASEGDVIFNKAREDSGYWMFCSTGTHKVRCNGADTKRRWWTVAADHTTKSSKLLSQLLFLCFGQIKPLPRLDGNELEETFPGNFAKLHWPDCDVPGWRTKRSRAFAWNVRDLSMSAAITGRGWTLKADARKPKKLPFLLQTRREEST